MADIDVATQSIVPRESLVRLTHLIYGLHAFSALMGILTSALIVTAFLRDHAAAFTPPVPSSVSQVS